MPYREYYQKRKKELNEYAKRRSKNKLDIFSQKANAANQRYPGHFNAKDIRTIYELEKGLCHWCKKKLTTISFTLEHLRPTNEMGSITIACRSCNSGRLHLGKLTQEELRQRHNESVKKWFDKLPYERKQAIWKKKNEKRKQWRLKVRD